VPDADDFAALQCSVDLDPGRLAQVVRGNPGPLEPLIRDLERDGPPPKGGAGAPLFELHPLLRHGDRVVVAGPMDLAVALRHALISMALEEGLREDLAEALWNEGMAVAFTAGQLMGWEIVAQIEPRDGIGATVASFDLDKAAVITIVSDDLTSYDPSDPEAVWGAQDSMEQIEMIRADAERQLMCGRSRPNEILHVTLMAGCGRPAMLLGMGPQPPLGAPTLLLSAEAFETIADAGCDRLELWKYAQARARLDGYARVFSFDALDEYSAWRDNDRSFYFGDESPTLVMFQPDHGAHVRAEVAEKQDRHPVRTPEGAVIEVRKLDVPPAPIYGSVQDLGRNLRQLVELAVPVWVRSSADIARSPQAGTLIQLMDCVSYWLWQFEPSLPDLRCLAGDHLIIDITVEDLEAWESTEVPEAEGPVAAFRARGRVLDFEVKTAILPTLDRGDNLGERELLAVLLEGLDALVRAAGGDPLGDTKRAQAVDAHAPLGPKKKINLFRGERDFALVPGPLPPYRKLQAANVEDLLDRLGPMLRERLSLEVGPIGESRHGEVLREATQVHLDELAALVASLDPEGLLEQLVAQHEATLRGDAVYRVTYGAKAACYGAQEMSKNLRQYVPDEAGLAVAQRFLIEFAAARPPHGIRPVSQDVMDRALALASQVANRGWAADIAYYELADLSLSILPSGRLGTDREGPYFVGQHAFLDAATGRQARTATGSYARHWEDPEDDQPEFMDELEAAARAEWGLSWTELGRLSFELVALGQERSMRAAIAGRSELSEQLTRNLRWPAARVQTGLDLLALRPRKRFDDPGPDFSKADLYPWRYNRELSYVRRPLLVRLRPDGSEELVWGFRHMDAAARHLANLIMSERLKARSPEMRKLMTRLRQAETRGFTEQVAARCRQLGLIARTNVHKIGGQRISRADGQDAGDIDVLAADTSERILHALECKDLEAARTPAELHNELDKTFGSGKKKRSAAEKHLERVTWLNSHVAAALELLDIDPADAQDWRVQGRMVVDVPVMAPFIRECPLPVTAVDELNF
jgi:hypothetical protein